MCLTVATMLAGGRASFAGGAVDGATGRGGGGERRAASVPREGLDELVFAAVEGFDRGNDVDAFSRDTRVRSRDDTGAPWLLFTDCLNCCDARGGDGDGLSLVMIFAAPSEVIERRTKEDDFLKRRSESMTVICSRPGRYSAGSCSSLKDDARRLFAR